MSLEKKYVQWHLAEHYRQHKQGKPGTVETLQRALARYLGRSAKRSLAVKKALEYWDGYCAFVVAELREGAAHSLEADLEDCWEMLKPTA